METKQNFDLFGNPVDPNRALKAEFSGVNPFTVFHAAEASWQQRKNKWRVLGIKSELGRTAKAYNDSSAINHTNTSIFDPVLCEIMYDYFCPAGGRIIDPFAGGSVRGIVANMKGYNYTGIDLRAEQVAANEEQGREILRDRSPLWLCGDSEQVTAEIAATQGAGGYDMALTCPPYVDLERYSDAPEDLSTMKYEPFIEKYGRIIKNTCNLLRSGAYFVIVVGEVRDKQGYYYGFVPDTFNVFRKCGMKLYNEAILETPIGTAMFRARGNMKTQKLVKTHQNILVFKKP